MPREGYRFDTRNWLVLGGRPDRLTHSRKDSRRLNRGSNHDAGVQGSRSGRTAHAREDGGVGSSSTPLSGICLTTPTTIVYQRPFSPNARNLRLRPTGIWPASCDLHNGAMSKGPTTDHGRARSAAKRESPPPFKRPLHAAVHSNPRCLHSPDRQVERDLVDRMIADPSASTTWKRLYSNSK